MSEYAYVGFMHRIHVELFFQAETEVNKLNTGIPNWDRASGYCTSDPEWSCWKTESLTLILHEPGHTFPKWHI